MTFLGMPSRGKGNGDPVDPWRRNRVVEDVEEEDVAEVEDGRKDGAVITREDGVERKLGVEVVRTRKRKRLLLQHFPWWPRKRNL